MVIAVRKGLSFRVKFALLCGSLGLAILLFVNTFSFYHTTTILRGQLIQQSEEVLSSFVETVEHLGADGDEHALDHVIGEFPLPTVVHAIIVLDSDGTMLAHVGDHHGDQQVPWIMGEQKFLDAPGAQIDPVFGAVLVRPLHIDEHPGARVLLGPDLHKLAHHLSEHVLHQAMLVIGGSIVIALSAWSLSAAITKRLVLVERGAAAIADGDSGLRIHVDGRDEVRRLAETVNFMADRLIEEREALRSQAIADPLTGLLNRGGLATKFKTMTKFCKLVSVLHIDLDRFKMINDTRGHDAGDAVLTTIATRLEKLAPSNALVARIGGDEFAMVLAEDSLGSRSLAVAEACIEEASKPVEFDGMHLAVGASVGVAHGDLSDEAVTADLLLSNADIALYHAKNEGRGRVALFDSAARSDLEAQVELERDVSRGINECEFVPFVQPQVDTRSNQVIGGEVLARWRHPTRGVLAPSEFLARLRQPAMIEKVTELVRLGALNWMAADPEHLPRTISFNYTSSELARRECAADLQWELALRGLESKRIVIEVLEDVVIREGDAEIEETLHKLRTAGHSIEFDDFGTGNSGLTNLVRLSVEQIKIERRFVMDIDRDPTRRAIVEAMVGIGRALDINVLAEGVETEAEAETLKELGCYRMQGYLFGRPMPIEDFGDWVRSQDLAA